AAGYSLMDLLDSHDTARLLWQLTPGEPTTAAKELNPANVTEGKARLKLASLLQFGVPGAPTIYYGDEVGMTGADDPDDRRTYPWVDGSEEEQGERSRLVSSSTPAGAPDYQLRDHYRSLIGVRKSNAVLRDGDFRMLLSDDMNET